MSRVSRVWNENRATILVVGALFVAYLALRTSPTEIASAQEFASSLEQGRPTVVAFYSNY